jgi:hypothetical protein
VWFVSQSVQEIWACCCCCCCCCWCCCWCCFCSVSFVKISADKAVHFLRVWMKLHFGVYRETAWQFVSKERVYEACVLHHGVRHLQSYRIFVSRFTYVVLLLNFEYAVLVSVF